MRFHRNLCVRDGCESTLLAPLVHIRALSELLQERMCSSHDFQRSLGGGQSLVRSLQLAFEACDLGLLGGEFADLVAGLLSVEDAGIALFAPLADQGRVQAFAAQVRASAVCFSQACS